MNDIICPNCDKAFKVDKAGFAEILKQVRDHQFEEELNNRVGDAVQLSEEKNKNLFQDKISTKEKGFNESLGKKDKEINDLKSKLDNAETEKKLTVSEATKKIEKERDILINELKNKDTEAELMEKSINEKYKAELQTKDDIIKLKDEEITLRKDLKLKLSTKMIGETLEQHCEAEFNKLRATGFQNAYFEKDSDASARSKGDYIYRETDDDENEIISIMFDMKNQNDETATKKKNVDFLKKLNKDRNDKKCEYAVLVSLLETDSELYNSGIVDVSHKYEKMYVVRPQFFIPIITLLRNAAMNSLKYKQQLHLIRNQNLDITNFEEKLDDFKDKFSKNWKSASNNFEDAINEIDKSIARMQAVKRKLTTSENQLRLANKKAQELTIKKLTYNNPTMKSKFEEAKDSE